MQIQIDTMKSIIVNNLRYEDTRRLLNSLYKLIGKSGPFLKDSERIIDALNLMLWAHFEQKDRPDGQPYINHPLSVALHIINDYNIFDPDLLIAALLHDTIEDQPQKILDWGNGKVRDNNLKKSALGVLEKHFGAKVALLVDKLTNPDFEEEPGRLATDSDEKDVRKARLYLKHFENLIDESQLAFVIKMADFSENAFHIELLEEGVSKDWLRRKYGPVIQMLIGRLTDLKDQSHPLFSLKDSLIEKLLYIYDRDYRTP